MIMEVTTQILYPLRTTRKRKKKKVTKRTKALGRLSQLKVGDEVEV